MHKCNAHALFLGEMLRDNQDQPVGVAVISIITFYFLQAKIVINSMYPRRIRNFIQNFLVLYLLNGIILV